MPAPKSYARGWLGALTLASLVPLLVWDVEPQLFGAHAHDVLAAAPLTLVAAAYLIYQAMRRAPAMEFAKAVLSALAFVFWALNQLLPGHPRATLFNDIAVAAFVVDIVLVIVGWPALRQAPGARAETTAVSDGRIRTSAIE